MSSAPACAHLAGRSLPPLCWPPSRAAPLWFKLLCATCPTGGGLGAGARPGRPRQPDGRLSADGQSCVRSAGGVYRVDWRQLLPQWAGQLQRLGFHGHLHQGLCRQVAAGAPGGWEGGRRSARADGNSLCLRTARLVLLPKDLWKQTCVALRSAPPAAAPHLLNCASACCPARVPWQAVPGSPSSLLRTPACMKLCIRFT